MKKIFVSVFFLCVCLCFVSCKNAPTAPRANSSSVTIKGNFTGGVNANGISISGFLASLLGESVAYALDYTLVKKVAVITTGSFLLFDVVNGGFQVNAQEGWPAGLIFIGDGGSYLGYLTLGSGVESLPLNMLESGSNSIDLQTLSSNGTIVEPGHNPIGNEIPMTAGDISSYAFSNGPLGAALKAPDADGDGVVDVVNGRFYTYTMLYSVNAGNFGSGLTPVFSPPVSPAYYRLGIKIFDSDKNFPASIGFSGAAGSGIESVSSEFYAGTQDYMKTYYSPAVPSPVLPPAGVYTVSYKTKTLTFNVASEADIVKYLAIPIPTVYLNGNGTINKITWEYKLSDGSSTVDPLAVIGDVFLTVSADPGNTGNPVYYQLYDSPTLAKTATSHTLTNQSIAWSSVVSIDVSYHDIFGNNVGIGWNKP